jgi:hypothetical protein
MAYPIYPLLSVCFVYGNILLLCSIIQPPPPLSVAVICTGIFVFFVLLVCTTFFIYVFFPLDLFFPEPVLLIQLPRSRVR